MDLNKMYSEKVKDPFTGTDQAFEIDISDRVEMLQFEALKKFIVNHLRCALDNEDLKSDAFRFQKLEWLIVQMYEPKTHITLINKLLKFKDHLFGVKEYTDVLKELKCMPEEDLTVGDIKTDGDGKKES